MGQFFPFLNFPQCNKFNCIIVTLVRLKIGTVGMIINHPVTQHAKCGTILKAFKNVIQKYSLNIILIHRDIGTDFYYASSFIGLYCKHTFSR